MKKKWLVPVIALLAGVVLIVAVLTLTRREPVPAVRLEPENVVATLTVTGEVRADTAVAFSPPVNARIVQVTVEEGDAILPGQLLVQLDAGEVRAQLNEAQARAAQAQATLANVRQGTRVEEIRRLEAVQSETAARVRQIQASLNAAQARAQEAASNARRMESLFRDQVATAQEYEAAQTQAEVTRREVERLRAEINATQAQRQQVAAQLLQARRGATLPEVQKAAAARDAAQAAVRQTSERLSDFRITSTLSGIVTERLQDPGDLAMPGQPVLRAVNPATLEVICFVEETDLPRIQVGSQALVVLDAQPERGLEAQVHRIGSRINPKNGTVEVRVALLPEAYGKLAGFRLLPGMTADVNVITGRLQNALVLPASAVRQEGGSQVVYVIEGNRIRKRAVQLERISVENYRVLSGLEPGDWVAATAGENLLNRGRVRPVPPEESPQPSPPPGGGMTGR